MLDLSRTHNVLDNTGLSFCLLCSGLLRLGFSGSRVMFFGSLFRLVLSTVVRANLGAVTEFM